MSPHFTYGLLASCSRSLTTDKSRAGTAGPRGTIAIGISASSGFPWCPTHFSDPLSADPLHSIQPLQRSCLDLPITRSNHIFERSSRRDLVLLPSSASPSQRRVATSAETPSGRPCRDGSARSSNLHGAPATEQQKGASDSFCFIHGSLERAVCLIFSSKGESSLTNTCPVAACTSLDAAVSNDKIAGS